MIRYSTPKKGLPVLVATFAALTATALVLAACLANTAAPTFEAVEAAPFAFDQPVVIIDDSGIELGDGTVNLYAPSRMQINQAVKIRLEIVGVTAEGQGLQPPPSDTSTATPSAKQVLSIHEIMGATLQGVDISRFTINTIPTNGLRNVDLSKTTWWEWNLRPSGPQALGQNSLELYVYYPKSTGSGAALNEEIAIFPINIEVVNPDGSEPSWLDQLNASLSPVVKIAGAITAIAGAIGVVYGAYRYVTRKPRKRRR